MVGSLAEDLLGAAGLHFGVGLDMAENVDITLLAKVCQDTLAETKAIRHDLAAVQQLAVRTVDVLVKMEQRNEARFNAMEARFAALENRFSSLDHRFSSIDDRFDSIDDRFDSIDDRFAAIDKRFASIDSRFVAVDGRLRGIDQRIGDLKDELGLMIKSELMGALGNFETKMIALIDKRLTGRD